uniref:Mitogen-activated protein kinase kinase kinase YODA-like isoform X2 n=1 Tax=Rhizophora mucronata TaxID=61149 RepID=A0A2P2NMK3_RHIMU
MDSGRTILDDLTSRWSAIFLVSWPKSALVVVVMGEIAGEEEIPSPTTSALSLALSRSLPVGDGNLEFPSPKFEFSGTGNGRGSGTGTDVDSLAEAEGCAGEGPLAEECA